MLPKELLKDLEKGDRTVEFLRPKGTESHESGIRDILFGGFDQALRQAITTAQQQQMSAGAGLAGAARGLAGLNGLFVRR